MSSNGKNGIQNGGGGAGGAVSLDYNFIAADANFTVTGGTADRGGSGSGGRIRMWNHNWQN